MSAGTHPSFRMRSQYVAALLWFDFALTFPTEVRRIWGRPFSGATLVYLFTRYTAIADRVLFVTEVLLWNSSDQVRTELHSCHDVRLIPAASRCAAEFRVQTISCSR